MKHLVFVLALYALPLASFAQPGHRGGFEHDRDGRMKNEASSLSIFSENGDMFYLLLNSMPQNRAPVSRIRVEGLPQYGNAVQIMFADNITPAIFRNVNITDPLDGNAANMKLKIARGRDGIARLHFVKCTAPGERFEMEHDEYIMNYGNPARITYQGDGNNEVVTQTYTQTNDPYQPPPPPAPRAMDGNSFNDAMNTINGAAFEDTKKSTAKAIFTNNYLNTEQLRTVCGSFSFDDTKLAVIKMLYSRVVDPGNLYKLADIFAFDSNKGALNKFIMANQH